MTEQNKTSERNWNQSTNSCESLRHTRRVVSELSCVSRQEQRQFSCLLLASSSIEVLQLFYFLVGPCHCKYLVSGYHLLLSVINLEG